MNYDVSPGVYVRSGDMKRYRVLHNAFDFDHGQKLIVFRDEDWKVFVLPADKFNWYFVLEVNFR